MIEGCFIGFGWGLFDVAPGEVELLSDLVRKGMGSAFELKAPLDVSIGIGSSWNEAAH